MGSAPGGGRRRHSRAPAAPLAGSSPVEHGKEAASPPVGHAKEAAQHLEEGGAASTDVRRTAGGLAAGGAHEGSRPPKTAAAAASQTLPRLHSSEAKVERGARRIQGAVDALACPAGAHGKGRRWGQTQRGAAGSTEAVRARHESGRNPRSALRYDMCRYRNIRLFSGLPLHAV